MKKNKLNKKAFMLIIILVCLTGIVIFAINNTISKYESTSISSGNIEVAFYILNGNYQSMTLNLLSMIPQAEPYVKTFTIANNNGTNRTETSLEYDLEIQTTTNLPLTYALYCNQNYNDVGATDIITTNNIEQDEYGTYFRKIKTDTKSFGYENNESNTYQLVIYFPNTYTSIDYQNIIESVEIKVNSKQVMD
jgi:hypothetical protein